MTERPACVRAALLGDVPHGFFGRAGGVSKGIYAGLNVGPGSDDDPAAVAENRRRAVEAVLPGAVLLTPYQTHSIDVVTVTSAALLPDAPQPRGDALVTRERGVMLGIVTADCAPILLADQAAGIIGAAHAGWKGALGGIVAATVEAMVAIGARRDAITAAIGPCIAQASYEVDAAFARRFEQTDPGNRRFFVNGVREHCQFDLEGYVAARLAAQGCTRVEATGIDTYPANAGYFSFRRTTHRGEPGYGRQLSLISLWRAPLSGSGRNTEGQHLLD